MNWIQIIAIFGMLFWMAGILAAVAVMSIKFFRAIKYKEAIRFGKADLAVLSYCILVPIGAFEPPLRIALDVEIYGILMYPTTIYEDESERAFNGDGSSFSVRQISERTKKRMIKKYESNLVYPGQKDSNARWTKYNWQRYSEKFDSHLDFALSWANESMRLKILTAKKHDLWIGSEIRYHEGDKIGDAYVYILDATTNELYELNANT